MAPSAAEPVSAVPYAKTVRHFDALSSTNSWAVQHASEFDDDCLPVLVSADIQSAGRGRSGRSWFADRGTLAFSILDSRRRLRLDLDALPRLALVAGLSVAEAIDAFIPPTIARLKWPNDVYVAGGKVAGLLIESAAPVGDRIVIGVGVNVATDLSGAPAEIRQRARSLAEVAGRPLDRDSLLAVILERMAANVPLTHSDFGSLVRRIQHRCLLRGNQVTLKQGPRALTGHCLGIDGEGMLRIESSGTLHTIRSGEIVRLA